jgi:Right handed beta helix region/Carbohydrate binding domain
MAQFPDATTTGVRDGVTLTPSGGITINTAGAVVSGLNITGDVVITAPNVTLVDCKITGNVSFESTGGTMEYCDVIGRNSLDAVDINPNGHVGEGDNTTIRFCDISNAENGIWLEGQNALIEGNYIHFLQNNMGVPPNIAHIDGIQVPGSNIGSVPLTSGIIRGNTIDMTSFASTSAFISLDASNIEISNNHLSGGAATVYFLGNGHGNLVSNNTIDSFAYEYIAVDPGTTTVSGNIDGATGLPFPGQDPGGAIAGSVSISDAMILEGDSGTDGATISDNQGVGTITNDDGAVTPNLVVNGGFESGDLSGWTLSGNTGGHQIYIAPTDFPGDVHTGGYSAGLGSMNRTDGILTQDIATTAGQHYTLSFWIESDNGGSTPINHFAAKWNGQTLMAVTDAPNSGYQLHTFDVVGINGNSVLEFDAYNHPDAWRLDDVTLTTTGAPPPHSDFLF